MSDDWQFPTPRYHFLDIWMALGGDSQEFEKWMAEPRRTPADAWSQLMAAISCDLAALAADTNPPAGTVPIRGFLPPFVDGEQPHE